MTVCPCCGQICGSEMTPRGLCYECATGNAIEGHHIWGEPNSPETIAIPGNLHRNLHELKAERCDELKNPGADPIRQTAAKVITIGEAMQALADDARRNGEREEITGFMQRLAREARDLAHWLLCHIEVRP